MRILGMLLALIGTCMLVPAILITMIMVITIILVLGISLGILFFGLTLLG